MADTTLTDPLGRDIVLHDRTWYGHIVKGHPDMSGHYDENCRIYFGPGRVRVL